MSIVIVDYGAGNLASLARGLSAAGGEVRLARSTSDAIGAKAIVIPGVGHFSATSALGDDWKGAIRDHLARGGALLGVCLGMQWLFEGSDEAPDTAGLGLLRGRAVRLTGPVKVPHSGWNSVLPVGESRILGGTDNCWAYFTHSFALPVSAEGVAGVTTHGDAFAAVIERGRVWGLQYHPELSGSAGAEQLRRFVSLAQGNACAVPGPLGSTQIRQAGAARRLIACLDVRDGAVVKGVNFEQLRNAGDPAELARRYNREGIDELVLLDVTATTEARATRASTVTRVARELSVPFAVGGGIRELDDARCLMEAGSDKVCVNSAALDRPALIGELARLYGSQAVVVAIDAKREAHSYRVFGRSGAVRDGREAVSWAREAEARGAGEILLTSIDRDGTRDGFDCELTAAVSDAVSIPVIASGGAGRAEHFAEVFTTGRADAALAASVFHYQDCSIRELKQQLASRGIPVRPC